MRPASFTHDPCRHEEILRHIDGLKHLCTEPYADLIVVIFGEKFTLQHAILLSVLLRRMDCCDLEPFEISCL
jgi:hypothetical protein